MREEPERRRGTERAERVGETALGQEGLVAPLERESAAGPARGERELPIDNLLVRIHSRIEINLVDRPCAMGV